MLISAWGADQPAALIIRVIGWFLALTAACEMIFPSLAKAIGGFFWNIGGMAARIAGILSVGLGAFFIYLGLWVF